MPAGKMVKYVPKRRRTRRASRFKKAVTAIAKRTVMRQSETKTASINWTGAVGTDGRLFNVYKNITQGDAQQNRDGDRLKSLGVKIRGDLRIDSSFITANEDGVYLRVVVFSAKRPIASVADAGLTYLGAIDPELINVISDRYVLFKKDGRVRNMNTYIKFNRNVMYNPTGTECSKNELYCAFIAYQALGTGMTALNGTYVNLAVQPYWKDL